MESASALQGYTRAVGQGNPLGEHLVRANGELIGVAVNAETLEKISIPDTLKTAMQTSGEDWFIDHAGLFTAPQII